MLWITFIQKKADSQSRLFSRYILFRSKNLVAGIAETGNDIPVLVQSLIDRGLEVPMKKEDSYSRDSNIWHISHEGLDLEDPANEPKFDSLLKLGVSPEQAPDKPTYVSITFEKGIPVAID